MIHLKPNKYPIMLKKKKKQQPKKITPIGYIQLFYIKNVINYFQYNGVKVVQNVDPPGQNVCAKMYIRFGLKRPFSQNYRKLKMLCPKGAMFLDRLKQFINNLIKL